MTLIIGITSRSSVWLLADRRLTYGGGRFRDDARKLLSVETRDGVALLGYAGLGSTAQGTEPGDWMGRVVRGRRPSLLEPLLGEIASAIAKRFRPHVLRLMSRQLAAGHDVVVPAFVGNEVRLYSIGFATTRAGNTLLHFHRQMHSSQAGFHYTPPIMLAGSGARVLQSERRWGRELLSLVKAHERNQVPAEVVADRLAAVNETVSKVEATVGPRCIVIWRCRRNSRRGGGGGHQYYSGSIRERTDVAFPQFSDGMDVNEIVRVSMPYMMETFKQLRAGGQASPMDSPEFKAAISGIADSPDDSLE